MVLCLLVVSPVTLGMGFGELTVESTLGQPLQAQISLLSVTPVERASLSVHVADEQLYRHFGLTRNSRASLVRVHAAPSHNISDRVLFNLTSAQPINTAVLELLVVAQTARGKLLRQYTILLDPSDRQGGVAGATSARVSQYGPIEAGESLWNIASAYQYRDVSIQQMLVALYRHNPDAFAGSIGRLRVGSELAIPTRADVRTIDTAAARRQVAGARRQRLQRLVAAVADEQAAVTAKTRSVAGGGRLRLVTPRHGEHAAAQAPVSGTHGPAPDRVAPSTGDPAFGVMAIPAVFVRGTATRNTAVGNTSEHRSQPAASLSAAAASGAAASGFGRLATAPIAFPPSQAQTLHVPVRAKQVVEADDKTASTAQRQTHNSKARQTQSTVDAPAAEAVNNASTAEPVRKSTGRLALLRMALWAVVTVCLLFAAGLWMHSRRRRPRVTVLAGAAAAEAAPEVGADQGRESESVGAV